MNKFFLQTVTSASFAFEPLEFDLKFDFENFLSSFEKKIDLRNLFTEKKMNKRQKHGTIKPNELSKPNE